MLWRKPTVFSSIINVLIDISVFFSSYFHSDFVELLVKYTSPNDTLIQAAILRRVSDYCGKPVTNYKADKFVEPMRWSFYHAFFFAFTVCSTVGEFFGLIFSLSNEVKLFFSFQGYGNISPSNTTGQMFMIFYALIGIPVNGFLFAYLGDFFGKVVNAQNSFFVENCSDSFHSFFLSVFKRLWSL